MSLHRSYCFEGKPTPYQSREVGAVHSIAMSGAGQKRITQYFAGAGRLLAAAELPLAGKEENKSKRRRTIRWTPDTVPTDQYKINDFTAEKQERRRAQRFEKERERADLEERKRVQRLEEERETAILEMLQDQEFATPGTPPPDNLENCIRHVTRWAAGQTSEQRAAYRREHGIEHPTSAAPSKNPFSAS